MKLVSWNVNGLRAVLNKGFNDFVKRENPDVLCLQETKIDPSFQFELPGYHASFNYAEKKGYSGVAIFSKVKPISVTKGIGHLLDSEGRALTAEFPDFYLVNVYTPNAKDDLSRVPLRHKDWDPAFLKHCKALEKKKPVIFCGDLNVAHEEIDLKNFKANRGKKGFTDEEREGFTNFVKAGFIDTFRTLHPTTEKYSWWSYFGGARERNVGWRIDYFLASQSLKQKIKSADILDKVTGSDHAPVILEMK